MPDRTFYSLMGVVPNGAVFSPTKILSNFTEQQLLDARQAFLLPPNEKLAELTRIVREVGLLEDDENLAAGNNENARNLTALGTAIFNRVDGLQQGRGAASGPRKGAEKDLTNYVKRPTVNELPSDGLLYRRGDLWKLRKDLRSGIFALKNAVAKTVIVGGNPNDVNAEPGRVLTEPLELGHRDHEIRIQNFAAIAAHEHIGLHSDVVTLFREFKLVVYEENDQGVGVSRTLSVPEMVKFFVKDWKRSVAEGGSNVMVGDPQSAFGDLTAEAGTLTVSEVKRLALKLPKFALAMMIAIYEAVAEIFELQGNSFTQITIKPERDNMMAGRLKTVDVIAGVLFNAILNNTGSLHGSFARVAGLPSAEQDVNHGLKIAAIQTWSTEGTYQNFESSLGARGIKPGSDVANDSMVKTLNESSCSWCGARGHVQNECLYWRDSYPNKLAKAIQAQDTGEYNRLAAGYSGLALANIQKLKLPVPTSAKDKNGNPCYSAITLPKRLYQ
jgi:hypothetical protein